MFLRNLRGKRIERYLLQNQGCVIYCPKCRNELISSGSFVEDNDGIVKYKCTICENISFWDFIHYPIPYLRTCADCCHLYFNSGGGCECEISGQCDPDTMTKFKVKHYR